MRLQTGSTTERQLFVSLKVAEVCNFGCPDCYFFEFGDASIPTRPRYMTFQTAKAAASFLAEGVADLEIKHLRVALHGGEPLMIGKPRLEKICAAFHEALDDVVNFSLAIQTNGALLDDEWIRLLSDQRCRIGLSLDGLATSHDAMRPDKRGAPTYERVVAALRRLQRHEAEGRLSAGFGVLCVIDPQADGGATYRSLVQDLDVKHFDFLIPQLNHETSSSAALTGVARFLREAVSARLIHDDPMVKVRLFDSVVGPFLADDAAEYRVNYLVDMAEGISIRSDGDICTDDALAPLAPRFRDLGCNVARSRLREVYLKPVWDEIKSAVMKLPMDCVRCDWLGLCGGGPLETRFSDQDGLARPTVFCSGFRDLYEDVADYVGEYLDSDLIMSRMAAGNARVREGLSDERR